ncbi:hypothetical protein ACIP9H_29315 [Streptomyces sp. NPDC088732]|uniref:hypothetical protein n=1 Tax=Streptomyces sp. NPDC088732 TaxID=3365879 RepID=UPI003816CB89
MATILDELLVRLGVDAEGLTAGTDEAASSVEGSLKGIAAAGAGAVVGGLFAAGLESAMDITNATNRLQNQLALTDDEASRAGTIAGDVFAAGFGDSVETISDALGAVSQNLGGFSNLGSDELTQLTKDAQALSDTFEFDVAESTQAAGQLIKAGLAKDGTEAFDLLTSAAQKLPPAFREELPDVVKEYSEFFSQLGFSGPQAFGLLTEAAKNPTFEIDKLGDAIKEFSLRLADTKAVEAPLKSLGLNVKDIQKLVNTGQGTKAFDQVTDALRGVEDQTKRTGLQAALFGGPGEDLGNSLLKIDASAAAASSGMDDAAGSAKAVTESMQASPAQSWDSIMRTVSTTLGEALAPALEVVSNFLRDNPGLISAITPVVLALAVALGIWAIAQWAINSALLANPVTWIILGIVALVAVIVLIATKTTFFQDAWRAMTEGISAAWDWIWEKLQQGFKLLTDLFLNFTGPGLLIKHWDTIKSATSAAMDWVADKVMAGVQAVLDAISWLSRLPGMVGGYFGRLYDAARQKVDSLLDTVRGIPDRVRSAVGNLGSLLYNAGADIIRGLIDGVTGMIGALQRRFSSITSMIPDWKGPMTVDLHLLEPSGEALISGLMGGVQDQVPALRSQLQDITTSIPGNVNTGVSRAASSNGGPVVLELASAGGEVNDALLFLLQDAIRVRGGDPVIVLTPAS